jgi:VanZ family protein
LFGAGSWLGKQPALAKAMWLLLILMSIIYLFESKRKQRIIPIIQPLKNASVDFVKTIGRLYYQRHDNKNLAQKITMHFQDHVRSKYGIRTAINDPEFESRLAWKTGYDLNAIKDLLYYMNMLQDEPSVTDEGLLELNRKLEHFYKYV